MFPQLVHSSLSHLVTGASCATLLHELAVFSKPAHLPVFKTGRAHARLLILACGGCNPLLQFVCVRSRGNAGVHFGDLLARLGGRRAGVTTDATLNSG